jgi:hypothetical protein
MVGWWKNYHNNNVYFVISRKCDRYNNIVNFLRFELVKYYLYGNLKIVMNE